MFTYRKYVPITLHQSCHNPFCLVASSRISIAKNSIGTGYKFKTRFHCRIYIDNITIQRENKIKI